MMNVLPKRFAKYGLTLHPEKTRLLEFGRYAEERAKRQGKKKPGTFDFLGFTHICARSRRGKFTVHVRDDAQAAPPEPHGGRRMVPGSTDTTGGRAAEDPQRQAPRPLPVLRPTDELSEPSDSSIGASVRIWRKWLNRRTRGKPVDVGAIYRAPTTSSAAAASDSPCLGVTRRVRPEEPAAGNLHGGVCEGGDIPVVPWWT